MEQQKAGNDRRGRPPGLWRQVAVFVVVVAVASQLLIMLQSLIGPSLGTGHDNSAQWVQFAPALGVAAVVGYRRLAGVSSADLRGSVRANGATWRRALGGVVAGAVGILGWLLLMRTLGVTDRLFTPIDEGAALPTVLMWTLLGSFAEEFGWRAYFQPLLQNRFGFWAGTVVTGLIWGAWHIQVFAAGLLYALGFLVTTVALSFIMAFLIRGQAVGALWIAGAVHASFDLFGYLQGPGSGEGLAELWLQTAVVGVIAVVVMLLTHRARKGWRPRTV